MSLIRRAALAGVFWLFVFFIAGCGDNFRPIVATKLPPGGDPQALKIAVVISQNPSGAAGATTQVDLSGDTIVGQTTVGINPVHAGFTIGGGRTYIANKDESTLSFFTTFSSVGVTPGVVTLPPGAGPQYIQTVTAHPSSVYVAFSGRDSVGIVDTLLNIFTNEVPVGLRPVALASTPDGTKLYVANQGSNSVTVINLTDNTVTTTVSAGIGVSPSWLAASADNARVYVVNQGSNDVSVIDTATNTVVSTIAVGSAPNFAVFDPKLLRVYVTNPGSSTVSIINADPVSSAFNSVTNVTVGNSPVALAVLDDGSRVYVANSAPFATGDYGVAVINTLNNTAQKIVTDTLNPDGTASHRKPAWIAAPTKVNNKVVVALQNVEPVSATHPDASAILTINVVDNQKLIALPTPFSSPLCTDPSVTSACSRMKPSFITIAP